jgi:signal transduction histidine kinase/ActR/RegA family two-component response regulator
MREVLLIDDDSRYRTSIARLFNKKLYRFFEAGSASEAIAIIEANRDLRVMLLDLSLGHDSGLAVLDHIRSHPAHYRVILLSGHENLLNAKRAIHYNVFNYLPKAERSAEALRFSIEQAFSDLERAELEAKLRYLLEVQERINSQSPLPVILDFVCQAILATTGGYTCHIRVYNSNKGDYHTEGYAGVDGALRAVFAQPRAKGDLFSGRIVQTGETAVFANLQNDAQFRRFAEASLNEEALGAAVRTYWASVKSAYIVPISTGVAGAQVDAVLNVNSEEENFFTSEKQSVIREFAIQAAMAITRDWLQRKRNEIHHDYYQISAMMSEISDQLRGDTLLRVYDTLTHDIAQIINAEVVSVFLYNRETEFLERVAENNENAFVTHATERHRPNESLTGAVFVNDETILLPDESGSAIDRSLYDQSDMDAHTTIPSGRLQHFIGVPIKIGGVTQGVLRAINKKSEYYDQGRRESELLDRGFSGDDRNVLEIAASLLGVAIRNAELLQDRNRQVDQTRTLGEVGRLINSEMEIDDVLRRTIEGMAQVMEAEICLLFLKDKDRFVLRQSFGMPMLAGAFYAIGEGVTGGVAASGRARLIQKAVIPSGKYDAAIIQFLSESHRGPTEIASLMAVPIVAKSSVIGVMKVINKVGERLVYDDEDLKLFQTFADYVGVAIYNAQIYEHTNRRLAVAERNAALSTLVAAVAHEINNTSGVIPANVASIREELDPPSDSVERMLSVIEEVAKQATDFANEIAGFSASRRETVRVLDINEVIASAITELHLDGYKSRLDLCFSDAPLLCEIYRTPFKQIVRNVVMNGVQALAGRADGFVRVTTDLERWSEVAIITIEDNGPGIRPEHQSKIFDANFTTKATGNGLGLWLAKTQLEMMGGMIDVQSDMGKGARFILRIPISQREEGPA